MQGKADKTIDGYARAIRRLASYFDRCPEQLTQEDLNAYFVDLLQSHSWSTIKVDRNGMAFFWVYPGFATGSTPIGRAA